MKRFISILTCFAFLFSSLRADETPPVKNEVIAEQPTSELSDETTADPANDEGKKQVGVAANDGSKAAGSGAGKYVLAACAIAVGVAALILVSTHSGSHK